MLRRKIRIDRILCYYFQKLISTSIKTSIKIYYYFQIIVIFTGNFTFQKIIGRWLETSETKKRNILVQKFKDTEISIGTSNRCRNLNNWAMHLLRLTYRFLTICACWRPPLLSPLKNVAYTVYRYYVILLVYGGSICQFIDLIFIVETLDEFCDNIYLTLTFFISCLKMYSILSNRKNIIVITDMLESTPFQPETKEEIEIREKCERRAR